MEVEFWVEMIKNCDNHIVGLQSSDFSPKLPDEYRLESLWFWTIKKIEYQTLLLNSIVEDWVMGYYDGLCVNVKN